MQRESGNADVRGAAMVMPLPWPSVLVVLCLFWGWGGCCFEPCSGEGKDQRCLSCSLWLA